MSCGFTKEASGHNPLSGGKEKMRQRVMHKFSYFPENHNEFACVGCGRCIKNCPVRNDITQTIKKLRESKANDSK
jgi:predicted aldo/keto reductase-like oxidoreductase